MRQVRIGPIEIVAWPAAGAMSLLLAWQFLVPDVRWFPTTNAATRITGALVGGVPSAWLADSVRNSFPESVSLARPSVPLESGIAQVALSGEALLVESTTLDRMQTQLDASLATAGVTGAQMSVSTTPLTAEPVSTRSDESTSAPIRIRELAYRTHEFRL